MTPGESLATVTDLDPDATFRVNPEFVVAAFDDQVLLCHLGGGQALIFNRSAGLILDLIDSRCSAAEIRELLQRAYPESAEDAALDVDRTLRYLLLHGALESSPPIDVETSPSPSRGRDDVVGEQESGAPLKKSQSSLPTGSL